MSNLPSPLSTGKITGRFIVGILDDNDSGDRPNVIPASGSITFKASIGYIPIFETTEGPATMFKPELVAILDDEGYLCTPDPLTGAPMYRGVYLVATDSATVPVRNWTWNVSYSLNVSKYSLQTLPSHAISVLTDSEEDLTKILKVPSSPGEGIPQLEAAARRMEAVSIKMSEADALISRAEVAADRAEAGEFDGAPGGSSPSTDMMFSLAESSLFLTDSILRQSAPLGLINSANQTSVPSGESTTIVNGETIFMAFPYSGLDFRKPIPLIIHYQGAGGGAWPTDAWRPMMQGAIDSGYAFVSSSMGGLKFGGPDCDWLTRDMIKTMARRFPISDVIVSAESMGALSALNAVGRGIVQPLCLYLCQPTVDLQKVYEFGDPYASAMRSVFGISSDGSNLLESIEKYNPLGFPATSFRGVPTYVRSSPEDTLVAAAQHGDILRDTLEGYSTTQFSNATGNHGDMSHFIPLDYVTFMGTHSQRL